MGERWRLVTEDKGGPCFYVVSDATPRGVYVATVEAPDAHERHDYDAPGRSALANAQRIVAAPIMQDSLVEVESSLLYQCKPSGITAGRWDHIMRTLRIAIEASGGRLVRFNA